MKLEIKKITIENFKGFRAPISITFGPDITSIYANNHRGKTTIMDAILWLLFGKNSEDSTNFGISPKDEGGNIIHKLENKVSGDFEFNGRAIHFERIRKEVWKKSRGEEEGTYSYTTSFFIDGEKYTEKEYKQYINDRLMNENTFKALTNPAYFPSLKPDEQRKLLMIMAGDVRDEDIASQSEDFAHVLEKMKDGTLEELRQHLRYKKGEIKKELEAIPGRITENKNAISQCNEVFEYLSSESVIQSELDKCNAAIEQNTTLLSDLSKSVDADYIELARKRKEIIRVKTQMEELENEVNRINGRAKFDHNSALTTLQNKISLCDEREKNIQQHLTQIRHQLDSIAISKDDFRKRWKEVEAMTFVWDGNENCPTCGQRLPDEDIETLKAKARETFNANKQRKQDALDREAKEIKENERANTALIEDYTRALSEVGQDREKFTSEYERAEEEAIVVQDVNDNEGYQTLKTRLSQLEAELSTLETPQNDSDIAEKRKSIEKRLRELRSNRDRLNGEIIERRTNEASITRHTQRVEELEEQERTLNQQLTDFEREEELANAFFVAKTQRLQDRVNRLFSHVQFKMFNTLQNGDRVPTCECMLHGTPYQDLSNSEKINAGLDIISALGRYYDNGSVFCCIDNAEASNDIWPTGGQQIHLVVSTDNEIKVVYNK